MGGWTLTIILLIALVACEDTTPEPTPDIEATVQAAIIASAVPTETPVPTPDIQATVQAGVQATVEALHTPVPTVTVMPTPTPSPTAATTRSVTFKHRSLDIHFEVRALQVERGCQNDSSINFWLESGNEWVRVSLKVKNLADARSLAVRGNNFAIVDENTRELGNTFGAPKPIAFLPDKIIPPGSTLSGNIVLQTPVSASHLLLEFEPIFFDAQYLTLTHGSQAPAPPHPRGRSPSRRRRYLRARRKCRPPRRKYVYSWKDQH